MEYRVELTEEAADEAERAYLWIAQRSPTRAARWYQGLHTVIRSLSSNPERCTLAPESESFHEKIRQLLYGKRGGIYRILFVVRSDIVHVLHVRHGARKTLEP